VLVETIIYAVLAGALLFASYFAFGPQAFGLPVLIAVLVVAAGLKIFSNAGLSGLAFVILGLFVLVMIIGMAMRIGTDRRRPGDSGEPGPPQA
jgi:asparagine N-glycosylation enzyme membrane subunit Stt3